MRASKKGEALDSKAEDDLVKRYRWEIVCSLAVLLGVEIWLIAVKDNIPTDWRKVAAEVTLAIIPNLIASLLILIAVYLYVKDNDRSNYVRAMRTLRHAVKKRMTAGDITPEHVQDLMVDFVPAVSLLYFKSPEPIVPEDERNLNYDKKTCVACDKPWPVEKGRCKKCRDIRASWDAEEKEV
jgi:hypothetical protein